MRVITANLITSQTEEDLFSVGMEVIISCMNKSMKWVLVGLGNPGAEYEWTRHNTGRELVLNLVKTLGTKKNVVLLTPDTFMNKSGQAVAPLIKTKKAAEGLVVIRDDLDLPLGRVKMTFARGAGGHKGVESIKRAIKTEEFIQIKIGISPSTPKGKIKKVAGEEKVHDFILSKFKPAEVAELKKVYKKITASLDTLFLKGREAAMGEINTQ